MAKPKDTPTPEAERRDGDSLSKIIADMREVTAPAYDVGFDTIDGWIDRLAALALPAAQDGVSIDFPQVGIAGPFPVVDGFVHLPDVTMNDLIAHARTGYVPTPNAIRGDKGAEAVVALAGYIDYLRYDKAVKYADPTNVAVQTLRLSIADDLERIASPAAPTQAAAKEEGDKGAEQRYAELAQKWRRRVEARAENINIGPVEAAAIKQCATELEAMNSGGRPHD